MSATRKPFQFDLDATSCRLNSDRTITIKTIGHARGEGLPACPVVCDITLGRAAIPEVVRISERRSRRNMIGLIFSLIGLGCGVASLCLRGAP